MAGQEISEVFYWEFRADALHVLVGSTSKGALRVGIGLGETGRGESRLRRLYPAARLRRERDPNRRLIEAVEQVLQGGTLPDSLALDICGTPFQMRAWRAIAGIPFGQTRSYGEVALEIGSPGGARAVGQAMNRNPLALLFP